MPAQDKKYGRTRRELLHEEYVEGSKRGGIGQPKEGFEVPHDPAVHPLHLSACRGTLLCCNTVQHKRSAYCCKLRPSQLGISLGSKRVGLPLQVARGLWNVLEIAE